MHSIWLIKEKYSQDQFEQASNTNPRGKLFSQGFGLAFWICKLMLVRAEGVGLKINKLKVTLQTRAPKNFR